MRIISIGIGVKEIETTCTVCHSVIAYTKGDIIEDVCKYLKCLVCSSIFPAPERT